MTEQIDAVVLVEGQGGRLRPLTLSTPKSVLRNDSIRFGRA
jgi:NDP-sugar pyrophosphorylase family protein